MTELAAPTTPSASSRVRTPDAPQFGGYSDHYEPYTPRKSTRIAQKTTSNITPPPPAKTSQTSLGSPKRQLKKLSVSEAMDAPELVPLKKRTPVVESSSRRISSGTLTASSTATAAAALGLSVTTSAGMLITPAKTPQKAPTPKAKAKVSGFARTLFRTEEDSMPSRKPQTSGYKLDSMFADESFESIDIYTDSHERIPEVDRSDDNPFFRDEPRRSERQKAKLNTVMVKIPGEGEVTIEEAVKRTDGMLITFRGKRQFRKFTAEDVRGSAVEGGLESAVESPTRNIFARSSVKPRLLFPQAQAAVPTISVEDEEAETDIEDGVLSSMDEKEPATPTDADAVAEPTPDTPKGPLFSFVPASPPATTRTTRFASKPASPAKPNKKAAAPKKTSPFDAWQRTKSRSAAESSSTSQKRAGSPMPGKATKRHRV
ncbi:hypothetical protein QBC44DRAFT_42520 [Cladorrhinum sp. PSN332]|nr:hypothetical protein QBC44DRAFT_42520 [Cladorrhinum sp. PSN332]